ncbi:MAG: 4'-phosphopantetheinyl transferase superfamily protein [Neisseria sp.]|uniref:4'-phosphopantetheinyl transferase family protein n=1 Tax=Neisseria sp. TaxID=192066 RepID=UPI0026DB7DA1|nr:4'-phosphopantetheinyl transferase superfamily protein [Neisseria sp.]MDO4640185.1 4'-phosphopantetheinyl transferase superfamily protein [Neisseria sp.]
MMRITHFTCLIADEHSAGRYQPDGLDEHDRRRLLDHPDLARRADWQVSRYLKQQAPAQVKSLSHSKGAAAVLCGATPMPAGVDIETIRERDFQALAEWVATEEERQALAQRGWQAEDFYELWTLKEALLKAANLSFPDDMQQVGWQKSLGNMRQLHVKGQVGWNGLTVKIGEKLMLACVWQGEASVELLGADALGGLSEMKKW